MTMLRKNIALSLISLILCHIIAHGFSLHQTDVSCLSPESTHPEIELRGGGGELNDIQPQLKSIIVDFLSSNEHRGDFHIQGWRWHFMSLIRDSRRMERLAHYLSQHIDDEENEVKALEHAADYFVNFNMAGLHSVEEKMFVRWLRDNLCDAKIVGAFCENGKDVSTAFKEVIDKIDQHRIQANEMGKELYEQAKSASNKSTPRHQRQKSFNDVVYLSSQLSEQLQLIRALQEALVVPAIAIVVPSKTQKSFNNRVLLKLGVLESRIHLVGMHDAVFESGIESEKIKFQSEIPYVARIMIERWRKSLYDPKAGMLSYGSK